MRTIRDIMSTRVKTVEVGDGAEDAYKILQSEGFYHLVVIHDKRVVGVVSERDLGGPHGELVRQGKRVEELMSPHLVTINADESIRMAAKTLLGSAVGCLPVLEDHKLVGIITVTDLLELIADSPQRDVAHI